MMDAKMKGMVMAGMMGLSLILAAMAIFSDQWLIDEEEEDVEDYVGLSNKKMVDSSFDSEEECKATIDFVKPIYKDTDAEFECDGKELTMTVSISDLCSMLKDMDADSDDVDDCESTDSAGTMGSLGMWGGLVLALVATLMMVLPMAGVDAMDAIPEIGQKVISWGAGGLMLLGLLMWYFMLPDGDSSMASGLLMAGAAMSLALGSTAIGQFIPENE